MLPLIIGALVGGGILIVFIGLASSSPVDPVQARLTQLGSFQARNLEELELQQPFRRAHSSAAGGPASRTWAVDSAAHPRPARPRSGWPWPATRRPEADRLDGP